MGLVVDNFAGGGGASTGIEAALGRPIDIAINHSPQAIAMHEANHPRTKHYREDVWKVNPREVCGGTPVDLAWFSPDCTHFSRAKGAKPRSKKTRALAWVVVRWAREVRPAVIMLENVEEFLTWGPLGADGHPDPRRTGRTFRLWVGKLRKLGYKVEWRSLVAANYGAPTTRKRLFCIARSDGQPIVWPEPTHGRHAARPWRTAAEVIDWGVPCPSIFERKKPLAEATLKRIAAGLKRYVLEHPRPFVVPVRSHGGGGNGERSVEEPLRTVTATKRGEFAVVVPYIAGVSHGDFARGAGSRVRGPEEPHATVTGSHDYAVVAPYLAPLTHQGETPRVYGPEEPLKTVTAAHRGEIALLAPTLVQTGYGERPGQAPRALDLEKPLGTVTARGKHAAIVAFLAKHFTQPDGRSHPGLAADVPTGTVTARDHHSVVQVQLGLPGVAPDATASFVSQFNGRSVGAEAGAPLPTTTGRNHLAEVRAFLVKYYGSDGSATSQQQSLFGLVVIAGVEYQITGIGMRMLLPEELFRAQSFPRGYVLAAPFKGRTLNKTEQIELAGNSVCPVLAEALVRANCGGSVAAAEVA